MKELTNARFSKKDYRHMLVSEVKKEFGKYVEKYLEWELYILKAGLVFTYDLKSANIVGKYKKEIIEHILKHDDEVVQELMLNYIDDLMKKES